jgi:hypothetical protein
MESAQLRKTASLLILIIVCSLPFFLAEIIARTVLADPASMYIPSKNFRLIYELNPSHPEINSFGMRQEEFDPSNLHHKFVIAVIGDSHTYSVESASREKSFPSRLEYYLKVMGKNAKVLNFGVPGYDMAQELEVLKSKVLQFKPNLIILQYCINDEHISNYIQPEYLWLNRILSASELLSRAWKKVLYSEFGRTHLLLYIEKHFPDALLFSPGLVGAPRALSEKDPAHRSHPPRSKDEVPVRYHNFIGRENLEHYVKIFGELCKEASIPALATGFIEERDRNLYEKSGLPVYSFFEIFDGRDMRDFGYNTLNTSDHFSDRGSDFIGQAIANFIISWEGRSSHVTGR